MTFSLFATPTRSAKLRSEAGVYPRRRRPARHCLPGGRFAEWRARLLLLRSQDRGEPLRPRAPAAGERRRRRRLRLVPGDRGQDAGPPDDPGGAPFAALLQKYGAKRFVTGHTPQQSRSITVRFGGRAVLIDTGMLTEVYKGGRPSALEIEGEKWTAIYEDGRVPIR